MVFYIFGNAILNLASRELHSRAFSVRAPRAIIVNWIASGSSCCCTFTLSPSGEHRFLAISNPAPQCYEDEMNLQIFAVALAPLLLLGCSDASPANQSAAMQTPAVAPTKAATVAKTPVAPGCSAGIAVSLNRPLMARESGEVFPDARLVDFQRRLQLAFHSAADTLCADDAKFAGALKPIASVVARSGAGASEPTFYIDPDDKGALAFEWYFADVDLDVPARRDIAQGLRCWAGPARTDCADRGD